MKTNDFLQLFERRLIETIAWCLPKVDADNPADCLRVLEAEREEWSQLSGRGSTAKHRASVESLAEARAERLRTTGRDAEEISIDLHGGQLLACEAFASLVCGGAELESRSYINDDDIPPADTWVSYVQDQKAPVEWFSGYFVCWVPKEFVGLVEDGIACSVGWGLEWVKDLDTPFARQIQQAEWFRAGA